MRVLRATRPRPCLIPSEEEIEVAAAAGDEEAKSMLAGIKKDTPTLVVICTSRVMRCCGCDLADPRNSPWAHDRLAARSSRPRGASPRHRQRGRSIEITS